MFTIKNIFRVLIRECLFLLNLFLPKKPKLIILMYHSIDRKGHYFNVTPECFERQIIFLRESCDIVDIESFLSSRKRKIKRNTVLITFDDGLKNNLDNAYPILNKYKVPGIIYIPTSFLGKKFNNLEHLSEIDITSFSKKLITIGAHSVSHRNLDQLSISEQRNEILNSIEILSKILGYKIKHFSYPKGRYSADTIDLLKGAGVVSATTTRRDIVKNSNSKYELPRIDVNRFLTHRDFQLRFTDAYAKFKYKEFLR